MLFLPGRPSCFAYCSTLSEDDGNGAVLQVAVVHPVDKRYASSALQAAGLHAWCTFMSHLTPSLSLWKPVLTRANRDCLHFPEDLVRVSNGEEAATLEKSQVGLSHNTATIRNQERKQNINTRKHAEPAIPNKSTENQRSRSIPSTQQNQDNTKHTVGV